MMSLLDLTSNFSGGLPMPTNLSRAAVINQMSQGTSAPTAMDNSCGEDQQPPTKKSETENTSGVAQKLPLVGSKIQKKAKNSGQAYANNKGSVVKAKVFEHIDCSCPKRCFIRVHEEDRRKNFEKFWSLGHFMKQNTYLSRLVTREAVKTHRSCSWAGRGPKGVTYVYRVNVGRVTQRVCKKYFMDTYKVSQGRLARALKRDEPDDPNKPPRKPPPSKYNEETLQKVNEHINSFSRYDVNHTRNPEGIYLEGGLNRKRMYAMYVESCQAKQVSTVSQNAYTTIFKNKFGLRFLPPRKEIRRKLDIPLPTRRSSRRKKKDDDGDDSLSQDDVKFPVEAQAFCQDDDPGQPDVQEDQEHKHNFSACDLSTPNYYQPVDQEGSHVQPQYSNQQQQPSFFHL